MKQKVDKYDAFNRETYRSLITLPKFIYRKMIIKLLKRELKEASKNGLNNPSEVLKYRAIEEKYDLQMAKLMIDAAKILKVTSHSVYETSKDVLALDINDLKKYLEENKILLSSFAFHFNEQLKDALYYLALYAILEKSGVPVEIQNPKGIFQVISLFNKEVHNTTAMTDEDLDLLRKLASRDFNVSDLSDAEMAFIDSYHERYMEEVIGLFTNSEEVPKKKVLNNARKIYQRN